jgi:hypothetical protein
MAELDPRLAVFGCDSRRLGCLGRFQTEPLLGVCHESRREVMTSHKSYQPEGTPQRHLRPNVDIFYFPEKGPRGRADRETLISTFRRLASSDMRDLKHLAVDLTLWLYYRWMEAWELTGLWRWSKRKPTAI